MFINTDRLRQGYKTPLSLSQYRIWFLQNLYEDDVMYNTLRCFKFNGSLNPEALKISLDAVALRHEPLRTRLQKTRDNSLFQTIDDTPRYHFSCNDLDSLQTEDLTMSAEKMLEEAVQKPFHIYDEQMLRVLLIKTNHGPSFLLFVKHHLITDYASWQIFLREIAWVYRAVVMRQPLIFPPLDFSYSDFAKQQESLLTTENVERMRLYWHTFFMDYPHWQSRAVPASTLTMHQKPSYETLHQNFSSEIIKICTKIVRSQECSLFMLVLAIISLLASHLYKTSKVPLCFANANRKMPGTEKLIGCFFLNTIVSVNLSAVCKFSDLIGHIKENVANAWQHQRIPFEWFADELALECTKQRRPPYRIYISYRKSFDENHFRLDHLQMEPVDLSTGRNTHEDIVFDFWEIKCDDRVSLKLKWLWRQDVWDKKTIQRLAVCFDDFLNQMGAIVDLSVRDLLTQIDKKWAEPLKDVL